MLQLAALYFRGGLQLGLLANHQAFANVVEREVDGISFDLVALVKRPSRDQILLAVGLV